MGLGTVTALLAIILSGCATGYHERGWFGGGVSAVQISADTFRITARGNKWTGADTIEDYVLLKAAETTVAAGGTHFIVVQNVDRSTEGTVQFDDHMTTHVVGNTAYSTISPGGSANYVKPGQDIIIKVLSLPAGSTPVPGAMAAAEIIQFIGARVRPS